MPERIFQKPADYFSEQCTNTFKPRFDTGATGNCELCVVPSIVPLELTLLIEQPATAWVVGDLVNVDFNYENNSADTLTGVKIVSASPDFPAAIAVAGIDIAASSTGSTSASYSITQADIDAGEIAFSFTAEGTRGDTVVSATASQTITDDGTSGPVSGPGPGGPGPS